MVNTVARNPVSGFVVLEGKAGTTVLQKPIPEKMKLPEKKKESSQDPPKEKTTPEESDKKSKDKNKLSISSQAAVIFNRWQIRQRRLKTFNANAMGNKKILSGDFTGLQTFFVEFLIDFLIKMQVEWEEELEYLRSDYNHDPEALKSFRKTLKFRKENYITWRHLEIIGKYMEKMPYLCLSLHADWGATDERTLASLCYVIRQSYNDDALEEFRIRCRVTFTHDILELPQHMTSKGRKSMDEIAELLYYNPTVNRIKIPNNYDIRERKRLQEPLLLRFCKTIILKRLCLDGLCCGRYWGKYVFGKNYDTMLGATTRKSRYISPEQQDAYADVKTLFPERKKKGGLKDDVIEKLYVRKPWDPVDLFVMRQNTTGRVELRDKNFGLIGATCYLGACKALRNLRILRLRECNLNDGVADTVQRLCLKTQLVQIVLSNNYFGDRLIQCLATVIDHATAAKDLKVVQLDKNLISGSGFKTWKNVSRRTNRIEELTLGTDFFGNPLMRDSGTAYLTSSLTWAIDRDQDESESEDEDGGGLGDKIANPLAMMKQSLKKLKKKNDDGPELPPLYKFQALRVLRISHCGIGVAGAKAVSSYLCHHASLTLKSLSLDGNPIGDAGMDFIMKAFVHRLKIRAGGAHSDAPKKKKKTIGDMDDDANEEEIEAANKQAEEDADEAANQMTTLDLDLDEDTVLHQCERKAVGPEPVLEELSANDCLLKDTSLRLLMIFVRTQRISLLKVGGLNPMSDELRKAMHKFNNASAKILNMNKGFITVKTPIVF